MGRCMVRRKIRKAGVDNCLHLPLMEGHSTLFFVWIMVGVRETIKILLMLVGVDMLRRPHYVYVGGRGLIGMSLA